ncbi:hypothetical protein ACA910_012789 [Epithemia clementina (nom. ined.)]
MLAFTTAAVVAAAALVPSSSAWKILTVATIVPPSTGAGAARVVVSSGLRNLGNTCYLNAQLQCAFHIPLVRELVLTGGHCRSVECDGNNPTSSLEHQHQPRQENEALGNNNDVNDSGTTRIVAADTGSDDGVTDDPTTSEPQEQPKQTPPSPGLLALQQVFREMLQTASVSKDPHEPHRHDGPPVAPRVLAVALGIPVMEQQDSQEFWKLFLPALQLPALTQLYQGTMEDYIVALDGTNRQRRRPEQFLDLSLNVHADKPTVLTSLQFLFGKPELLSVAEGNGWRPEKGADKVDAHKGLSIRPQGLPPILQLHLKRFHYDWNRNVMEKLNNPVRFTRELDLSSLIVKDDNGDVGGEDDFNNENDDDADKKDGRLIYELQSVVVHVGEFGVGHYYAYVRPKIDEDVWYRFNDDIVTPVSFEEVVADATGGRVKLGGGGGENDPVIAASDSSKSNRKGTSLINQIRQFFSFPKSVESSSYGFGGSTSNAYVFQYVQRSAVPELYNHHHGRADKGTQKPH